MEIPRHISREVLFEEFEYGMCVRSIDEYFV
jgi:hypothetical protein